MSLRNGEKARAGIAKKRRTAQRAKDRAARAAAAGSSDAKSEAKPAKATK
jgi:hypothetical protein